MRSLTSRWWKSGPAQHHLDEAIADSTIHVLGILLAAAGGWVLLTHAVYYASDQIPALGVYLATMLAVLCVSLAYNLWPESPVKQGLARLDQSLIFLFIAGSYTPFLTLLDTSRSASALLIGVWILSLVGAALKLIVPGQFGRIAIFLYLAIGWSGLLIFYQLGQTLPLRALWLLLAGGMAYSLGILFHITKRLRFQNALWHLAVVGGALLHLSALYDSLPVTQP